MRIKKLLRLAAVIALLCLLFAVQAGAETLSGTCGEEGTATWSFDSETGVLTIDGRDKLYQPPEEWDNLIGVKEIVVGDQITDVESGAFRYFDSVVKLTVGIGIRQVSFDILGVAATVTFRGEMTAFYSYMTSYYTDTVIEAMSGSDMEDFAVNNGRTFRSIGSNCWTDGITNADQPALDEATSTFTVKTARELAWVAWKTAQGNTLAAYAIELGNDIDLSDKLWIPIRDFEGVLDGKGHTISNLRCAQGGLTIWSDSAGYGTIRNLFLRNVDCNMGSTEGVFCSRGKVQNSGALGTVLLINRDPYSNVHLMGYKWGVEAGNAYAAVSCNGEFLAQYYDPTNIVTDMTLSQIQSADFVETLNVLMEDAWDWKLGGDGYPVLDPTSSRSWSNNTTETAPKDGVYYVETEEELAYIAQLVNGGNALEDYTVKLMADLDLSGKEWKPIGCNKPFKGLFDGGGHTITGLTTVDTYEYSGLFGYSNGDLADIKLTDISVDGKYAGGLVGYIHDGTITNCGVEGIVRGQYSAGGLTGDARGGGITNCYAFCDVEQHSVGGDTESGGLVGYGYSTGKISNCYAIGTVTGKGKWNGGLVGYSAYNTYENCYAACDVVAIANKPGLVLGGSNDERSITSLYWCSDNMLTQDGIVKADVGIGGSFAGEDPTIGKTLSEMKQQSTFTGWDFETVWAIAPEINGGLPYLRCFGAQEEVPVTSLTISEETVSLKTGESWWLTVTTRPINATTKLTWESSAPAVASVSENGKVTALSAGTAVITVSGGSCSASCTVTVTQRQPEEYTIDSLTMQGEDGKTLTEIPKDSFFVRATITKKADAADAVVMIVTYTDAGQMLDLVFLEADVPGGTTYSLGTWLDNTDGKIGKIKAFVLPSLAVPTPLAQARTIE